jgi:hypothetical protein
MSAFFEFDFFIKEYLLYMKSRYPAHYKELRSCQSFTVAYSAIRTSYEELTNDYLQKIKTEMAELNSSGKAEVTLEGYNLWVREGNSDISAGTPVFSEDFGTLMPVLESDRYQKIIDDFPEMRTR